MKKIVSFEKELDFPSMIGEITSISLDNTLEFEDKNSISGEFKIKGTYKMTEASTLEEPFDYNIPVDIELIENFDLNNVKISIDNFYYEIVNDDVLKCNIDVLIDGIEEIMVEPEISDVIETKNEQLEVLETVQQQSMETELRDCDGDNQEQKELDKEQLIEEQEEKRDKEEKEEEDAFKQFEEVIPLDINGNITVEEDKIIETKQEENSNKISSLFEAFSSTEETFKTYSVYILRKDDTIESIIEKYNVTREELSEYNDLSNLEIGSKIVIPTTLNE